MKTALVCGAGGFIGSHMVKRLKNEGYWVKGVDLKEYIANPARDTEGYYRHVIAEKFAFEKRLIVSTLKQNGIYSLLTTPENLSIDVINKYLEMKSRQLL